MLTHLSIRNIVLIEALDLECHDGLLTLTGETGAGKSILLDSLGLALGMRAEAGLVRKGADKSNVTATFTFQDQTHPVFALLVEQDIDVAEGEDIMLRRSLTADGRGRAFINDQPVSVALLKTVGSSLVEIHGQFEAQGLLHVKTHKHVLDRYGEHQPLLSAVETAWTGWQTAREKLEETKATLAKNKEDQDYIKHMVEELERLSPEDGEEDALMKKRALLGNREKLSEAMQQCQHILSGESGAEDMIAQAQGSLGRLVDDIDHAGLHAAAEALDRASAELSEALSEIETLGYGFDDEEMSLDMIEERLFALRDCARKHNCTIAELPEKRDELAEQLSMIEHQDDAIFELEKAEEKARIGYQKAAAELSRQRHETAGKLEELLVKELPMLKLDKVQFVAEVQNIENPEQWTAEGADNVRFLVATNPGQTPEPLQKIASGGELSRLTLAFKVVMAGKNRVPSLVFDEIDSGVGGAVADAVGTHLKKLSQHHQVLVVTHSPQVAAKADHHWVISKSQDETTVTHVEPLKTVEEKQEEIARMLSGQDVTEEARAAAAKLIESKAA